MDTHGLSIYEMAYQPETQRLAIGCDEGHVYVYDMVTHKKVSETKCQQSDITSMLYVTNDRLIIGQAGGYIDVIKFTGNNAQLTHSLCINEAGDINELSHASQPLELMIGCQKGLLLCRISKDEQLDIINVE